MASKVDTSMHTRYIPKKKKKAYRFEKGVNRTGTVLHYKILKRNNVPMSWRDVIDMWRGDEDFCIHFSQTLASTRYKAFFWETSPCSIETLTNDFEMVLVDSQRLAGTRASTSHFREHFKAAKGRHKTVVAFPNLGHDALLVAPYPMRKPKNMYAHIGAFVKGASDRQQIDFWTTLGSELDSALKQRGPKPIWVSTNGLGVQWLHARLDSSPKYYQYKPFKKPPVKKTETAHSGCFGLSGRLLSCIFSRKSDRKH